MRRQDALTCKPTPMWRKALAWITSLAMVLMFVPAVAIPLPAWADDAADSTGVKYLDADGHEQTCKSYVEITDITKVTQDNGAYIWDHSSNWYVARGNITIDKRVVMNNEVNLILTNGCSLEVDGNMTVKSCGFTVYAQSNAPNTMGKLTATAASGSSMAGIGSNNYESANGTITINGGNITAKGKGGAAGIGASQDQPCGNITINGGIIEANGSNPSGAGIGAGKNQGAKAERITIAGGIVNAAGGSNAAGIGQGVNGSCEEILISDGAIVKASSISNKSSASLWNGVVFEGDNGKVYGSEVTPSMSFEIDNGKTLTVGPRQKLIVSSGQVLANNGTIRIMQGGQLDGAINGSNSHAVILEPNGFVDLGDTAKKTYGADVSLPSLAKAGYASGWFNNPSRTGQSFTTAPKATDSDVTYYASLTPNTDTAYTVEHYKQKADRSGYELFETESNKTGTTDATASATGKDYEGFAWNQTANGTISSGNIAGDGSLVLKLYYDRIYDVEVTLGEGMTSSDDFLIQKDLLGAMTDIVVTAADGYYFPDDYATKISPTSGVTVTRNDYTQITVSGMPIGNVALTLPAATMKRKAETPNVESRSSTGGNDGALVGTTAAMEYSKAGEDSWKDCTDQETTGLPAGEYKVRVKATGSTLASEAQTVTIGVCAAELTKSGDDNPSYFDSLGEAIAKAGESKVDCTVKLLRDVECVKDVSFVIENWANKLVVDLNGKTLSTKADLIFYVKNTNALSVVNTASSRANVIAVRAFHIETSGMVTIGKDDGSCSDIAFNLSNDNSIKKSILVTSNADSQSQIVIYGGTYRAKDGCSLITSKAKDGGVAKATLYGGTFDGVSAETGSLVDMLAEDYAFESASGWVNELSGKTLSNVSVKKTPIQGAKVSADKQTIVYGESVKLTATGTAQSGVVIGYQWYDNGIALADASDSELTVPNLTAGTHKLSCSMSYDGYIVSRGVSITVSQKSLAVVTVDDIANVTYTGSDFTPEVTVKDGDVTLKVNIDYTVAYENNRDAGNAIVKITGTGNYTGTIEKGFVIAKATLTIAAKDRNVYVGNAAPDLSKPELNRDYTVSGLFGKDQLIATPALKYMDADGKEITTPDTSKSGQIARIVASDAKADSNYNITYVEGKLTASIPYIPSPTPTPKPDPKPDPTPDPTPEPGMPGTEISGTDDSGNKVSGNVVGNDEVKLPSGGTADGSIEFTGTTSGSGSGTGGTTPSEPGSGSGSDEPAAPVTSVKVPETVTVGDKTYAVVKVADNAFAGQKELTEVILPETIAQIGKSAFENTGIEKIELPGSIASIGDNAFANTPLESIVIPKAATFIGKNAFKGCEKLKDVDMAASSVTEIASGAFAGTGIESVELPDTAKTIGAGAFENCKDLVSAETSAVKIGTRAFAFCENLKKVTSKAKAVGKEAFKDCSSLVKVDISKATEIGVKAFAGCDGLKKATLGTGLKTIGKEAFKGCKELKSITITSKQLSKKQIAQCLKGSKVEQILVQVGTKKQNQKYAEKYAKIFTKKIAGKKASVKAAKKPLKKK